MASIGEEVAQSTALPMYLQICETLRREIAAGRLCDGQRLPPERELAEGYGTTVRTLRKALRTLEDDGLLRRVQGSGNYVQSSNALSGVYSMFRLELREGGGLPTARVLSVDWLAKPADLPRFGCDEKATRIRRHRFLDARSCAVEEIWLDGGAGRLTRAMLSDSLYRTYQQHLGFWITRAEDRVAVGQVPPWAPPEFTAAPGATVGYIERQSWAQTRTAVEFSRTWFDPQSAVYIQRLG